MEGEELSSCPGKGSERGGLESESQSLGEKSGVWTLVSEGRRLGSGPLDLREEGWDWTLGSKRGDLGSEPQGLQEEGSV